MSVLTGRIAHLLGLEALKVVAVVFTAINVSLWLGVSIMTFKKGWKGRVRAGWGRWPVARSGHGGQTCHGPWRGGGPGRRRNEAEGSWGWLLT
jgi:hypothetical protein